VKIWKSLILIRLLADYLLSILLGDTNLPPLCFKNMYALPIKAFILLGFIFLTPLYMYEFHTLLNKANNPNHISHEAHQPANERQPI